MSSQDASARLTCPPPVINCTLVSCRVNPSATTAATTAVGNTANRQPTMTLALMRPTCAEATPQ